jgi:hypothetical protein
MGETPVPTLGEIRPAAPGQEQPTEGEMRVRK